ncbi:hypothetical protein A9R05_42305 (plasmid) [Burkholderia sp. KK1]|uniref:hypothetical protein n=1 Tax=Burkholderia sp. M701 TaxID=326454 RepID=UPI000979A0CF|nr:hypothetical protein [Burkholderia sp. M701]AQH05653.1 hypothetical protein A9R05_42305 [Burkholderia sp. KK1]
MTSKAAIGGWFDRGVTEGATHLIVVCDTFDHSDYPVFVKAGEDAREIADEYSGKNMQRVMEVYNLSMDKATQMEQSRAFNY